MTRLFVRRGRHCRHGSLTGWSCLSRIAQAGDDFSRPRRRTPLGVFPLTADPYPYDSPKDAA